MVYSTCLFHEGKSILNVRVLKQPGLTLFAVEELLATLDAQRDLQLPLGYQTCLLMQTSVHHVYQMTLG